MKQKLPVIRIVHCYISYFQSDSASEKLKQVNFRLTSLSFLKDQIQKKNLLSVPRLKS